jgi:hypothetical protein
VAAYGFNEAAGTVQVTDASGRGNTGTIPAPRARPQASFGGALSFNGNERVGHVNDAPSLDLTTGMTIEAWVKPST